MSTLTGIIRDTKKGQGGLKTVYITEFENISNQVITDGIATFNSDAGAWKKYNLDSESGSNLADKSVASRKEGTVFSEQTLTLIFNNYTTAKRNELKVLSESTLVAIVVFNNGNKLITGFENGLDLTEGIGTSGESFEVGSKLSPTFVAREFQAAPSIADGDYTKVVSGELI